MGMKQKGLVKRCVLLVVGLFIMAFGVVLSVKANLGTSPISAPPYVYSQAFPLTMGTTTILMNMGLILLQILLLRKQYEWIQLTQIIAVSVFGLFIDLTMPLVSWIHTSNYFAQWALCLLSCVVLGFGVFLEVKAKVTYLAGEGLSLALAKVFRLEFGKAKVSVDCSLVVLGVASSFLLLHRLDGVREGTVAAALLVGTIVRFYAKHISFIDNWLGNKPIEAEKVSSVTVPEQKQQLVITIAREYGSGGHEIGEILAKRLGIAFYDSKLIDLTALEGGFTPEYVKEHEQKLANTLLYDLYEQNYAYVNEEMPPLDSLFMVQSKVIRDIAERDACVIVGRCADFILKSQPTFNIFVHASKEFRIDRIIHNYRIAPELAEKEMERKDRERINYCRHYTHKAWGDAANYHLTVDSSSLGTDECAGLIIDAVQRWRQNR
jgi:Predicted membrane protein